MPMTFDSFESTEVVAEFLHIRSPLDGESLEDYRCFVADHDPDRVEAMELRTGRPWDKFSQVEKIKLIRGLGE